MRKQTVHEEVADVPFFGNDMNDSPPTTGKPLDPSDGPGKADAEIGAVPEFREVEEHAQPESESLKVHGDKLEKPA
jgi:hypothetical protein